jgi:predicted ABC-class ATPase
MERLQDTRAFRTPDASGSTSQATNIQEALELGCSSLIIDEDTAATNFMIRDARMQTLVAKEKEPITPFISKVKDLHSASRPEQFFPLSPRSSWLAVSHPSCSVES